MTMNIPFPPPHMLFHEPMEDREMTNVWNAYKVQHLDNMDVCEIDAADVCSVDEFGRLLVDCVTAK